MTIDMTTLIALIVALFGAAAWVVSRLEKIAADIAAMRADAKDFVTHEVCHRRRMECPCVAYINELQRGGGAEEKNL